MPCFPSHLGLFSTSRLPYPSVRRLIWIEEQSHVSSPLLSSSSSCCCCRLRRRQQPIRTHTHTHTTHNTHIHTKPYMQCFMPFVFSLPGFYKTPSTTHNTDRLFYYIGFKTFFSNENDNIKKHCIYKLFHLIFFFI